MHNINELTRCYETLIKIPHQTLRIYALPHAYLKERYIRAYFIDLFNESFKITFQDEQLFRVNRNYYIPRMPIAKLVVAPKTKLTFYIVTF